MGAWSWGWEWGCHKGTFEQTGTKDILEVTEMLNWIVVMMYNSTHLLKSLTVCSKVLWSVNYTSIILLKST